MNARAHELVATQLDTLHGLDGASALSVHALKAWVIVLITASSDEAVISLSEELGLGETEIRSTTDQWWRRASSEGKQGAVRIVVTGPHHPGSPPRDDAGEASS